MPDQTPAKWAPARAASSSWISPSPPSDGGEGWGEEVRFYWFPLSSVLSPLVPRGERMESLMQPWHILLQQRQRRFHHLFRGQAVMLVEVFGDVSRSAELAADAQRLHAMRDGGEGERVRNLRAHAADDLVVLDRDDAARGVFHGRADGVEVHPVDKGIVDDGGLDAFLRQLLSRLDGFVDQHAASDQRHVAGRLEHLRLAPLVLRVLDPGERIILAADEE